VRTGIIYATAIIVLVFIPLFALPGIEGRLFVPLGIAFIVSTLASLLVSVTITPVLCFYLLPSMKSLRDHDTKIVTWLKSHYKVQLSRLLEAPKKPLMYAFASVLLAGASIPFMASSFLPPFNEGTLLIGLRLNPGVSLSESASVASQAEKLVRQVPEVTYVGRRRAR
jgi:HME family heavy-metal exporter